MLAWMRSEHGQMHVLLKVRAQNARIVRMLRRKAKLQLSTRTVAVHARSRQLFFQLTPEHALALPRIGRQRAVRVGRLREPAPCIFNGSTMDHRGLRHDAAIHAGKRHIGRIPSSPDADEAHRNGRS